MGNIVKVKIKMKKCQEKFWLFLQKYYKRMIGENQYKNLCFMALYWLIASLFFLNGFRNSAPKGLGLFIVINMIFTIGVIIVIVAKYAKPPKHIRLFSNLVPLLILFIILTWIHIYGREMHTSYRQYFIAFVILCHIWFFNFILYAEEIICKKAPYMHRRYLEYLRNYVWLIIFMLFGYFTWQFNNVQSQLAIEGATIKGYIAAMSYPEHYPLCKSLYQLAVGVLGGVILVPYAFHAKLKEIEEKIID